MRMKIGIHSLANLLTLAALLAGSAAFAQQSVTKQQEPSSLELTYDYVRSNGPQGQCGCFSLNGGGAAYVFPLQNTDLSLVGRLGISHGGGIGAPNYNLTLVTYTAGARYMPKIKSSIFHPYGEVQIGGAHASGTLVSTPSLGGSNLGSAFAATVGGGVDLRLHKQISLKLVEAEYLVTTYANGDSDHQNNLRVSAGVTVSFCASKKCSASGK